MKASSIIKKIQNKFIPHSKFSIIPNFSNHNLFLNHFSSNKFFHLSSKNFSQDQKENKPEENQNDTTKEQSEPSKEQKESEKDKKEDSITKEKYKELKTLYNEQESKLEVIKKKFEDVRKAYLDNVSETEQIKVRYDREVANTKEFAITKFAKDILDVHDNFERAMDSIKDKDFKNLNEQEKVQTFQIFQEGIIN